MGHSKWVLFAKRKCKRRQKNIHLDRFRVGFPVLDASSKIPSGLLRGNANQFGDFDSCTDIRTKIIIKDDKSLKIKGKYCLANLDIHATDEEMKLAVHLIQGRNLLRSRFEDVSHYSLLFITHYYVPLLVQLSIWILSSWFICSPATFCRASPHWNGAFVCRTAVAMRMQQPLCTIYWRRTMWPAWRFSSMSPNKDVTWKRKRIGLNWRKIIGKYLAQCWYPVLLFSNASQSFNLHSIFIVQTAERISCSSLHWWLWPH